jgi:hypothetical protein
LAGLLGEEVLFGEAHLLGELERALADEQAVVGAAEDEQGDLRGVLDVADARDRAGLVRGAVHDGSVELDDAVGVGLAAVADRVIFRVVLDDLDALHDAVGGVDALGEKLAGPHRRSKTVSGRDAADAAMIGAHGLAGGAGLAAPGFAGGRRGGLICGLGRLGDGVCGDGTGGEGSSGGEE